MSDQLNTWPLELDVVPDPDRPRFWIELVPENWRDCPIQTMADLQDTNPIVQFSNN